MEKITTVEQLQNLCCQQQEKNQTDKVSILVCGGTGCQSSNSQQIIENLRAALAEHGLQDMVEDSAKRDRSSRSCRTIHFIHR